MGMLRLSLESHPAPGSCYLWLTNSTHRTTSCTARASFQNTQDSLLLSSSEQLVPCAAPYDQGHRGKAGERQGKLCLLLALTLAATCERSRLHLSKPTASTTQLQSWFTVHSALVFCCMLLRRIVLKVLLGRKSWFTFRNIKKAPSIQGKSQNDYNSFPFLSSILLRHSNLATNFCQTFQGAAVTYQVLRELNSCIMACIIWHSSSSTTSYLGKL